MSDDAIRQETAVSALFDAYYSIGKEICERIGHDWRTVQHDTSAQPLNGSRLQRCKYCNEVRRDPESFKTTDSGMVMDLDYPDQAGDTDA